MTGGWREQCGKQPPLNLRLDQLCNQRCHWHSHICLLSSTNAPQHIHPAAQADWHSFQPWHQPATVAPPHHNFPVLGSPLTPALLGARWSIPDTLSPPMEMKI